MVTGTPMPIPVGMPADAMPKFDRKGIVLKLPVQLASTFGSTSSERFVCVCCTFWFEALLFEIDCQILFVKVGENSAR